MRPLAVLACLATLVSLSSAQQLDLIGKDNFPQFRGVSGLPGGGFAVRPDGRIGFVGGAMSFSTPIAYTPNGGFAFGGGTIGLKRRFAFFKTEGIDKVNGNGSAFALGGLGDRKMGALSVSFLFLSGLGDSAMNLQYAPPQEGKVRFAVGVQDITGRGGSGGTTVEDRALSRSVYAVATTPIGDRGHLSFGTGTRRFKGAFCNGGLDVNRNLKVLGEYDGFHWNYGMAIGSGPIGGADPYNYSDKVERRPEATLYVGMTRGKYLTWNLAFSF